MGENEGERVGRVFTLIPPFILHIRHDIRAPNAQARSDALPTRFLAARPPSMRNAISRNDARPAGAHAVQSQPVSALALVLIVEDHEDTRFMLRTMLEMRGGVSVVEAENGEMATALAERLHPNLILIDGTLPLLDGFAATRCIRGLASAQGVPIVFLSGHRHPASEAKAFAAGCTDYLVKPFALGELERVLERHLSPLKSGSISRRRKG